MTVVEKLQEWKTLWLARKWMKSNARFLPAWHIYVGITERLFERFEQGAFPPVIAGKYGLDAELLAKWVDAGVAVGHLKRSKDGRVHAKREMLEYIEGGRHSSVGALIREMMELHMPTLLQYPRLLEGRQRLDFHAETHGPTVAETSSLLEKLAFPKIAGWLREHSARSVLDIGCGHAGYLIRLGRRFRDLRLLGIETNEAVANEAIRKARAEALPNLELMHADIEQWSGPSAPVDLILMNNILHYFEPGRRRQLLRKARRLLSDNGSIALVTPLYLAPGGQPFSAAFNSFMAAHNNLHPFPTERELAAYAEEEGYAVDTVSPIIREGSWYFVGLTKQE
ncbi:class I SAM-dependent methyltransferase [Paenibacillus caseinilyticus]|uniref:Methyltransferase domain-containing protein n=1 Tax=Paenibacillus mucilaginosus K02 TaxID=997761 RepID=I0BSY9_9BACL|nr:class I SAM-dependent methyltransferase [Paenibacillus mucilaginosus]AFH65486.2 hypothetical protein B2K_33090 [Paenibacillus mucilaginosus K02]